MEQLNYILGLDIGIASVGWAVVEIDHNEDPIRLIDVGVRTFNKAEVAKTGESLSLIRRLARGSRRLVRRKKMRLLTAKRLLKSEGILSDLDFNKGAILNLPNNCWELRVKGLDKKLSDKEWAAVLLHIIKHRGYLSQRKHDRKTDDKELGALLSGVSKNHSLLEEGEFRTAAELAINVFCNSKGHIRNQWGDYSHTFSRLDLQKEIKQLFVSQSELGNPYTSSSFEENIISLLMKQKEAISGNDILKMLGKCTYEKNEYKAAKNTYSAERFVWLTKLNNLRIVDDGVERALNSSERKLLIDEPYKKAKLTYAQVRKILELPDSAVFKGVRYFADNAESSTLMEMKFWHSIRKALESNNLKDEWLVLKTKPELLDEIGTGFSIYKTDDDITSYLSNKLDKKVLDILLVEVSFDKFIELSLKCLRKIIPLMEKGYRYDEAYKYIYGEVNIEYNLNDIKNPVVLRSFSQSRKVINAVIRLYGSPARIHIETARDIGKSFKERKAIEKQQEKNRLEKVRAAEHFKQLFPNYVGEPKAKDILKVRLYEQQQGKCLYSGKILDIKRLMEHGYVEIDHALPFSRTWDDSFNNKVLVLANENQNKGNKTPYEWFNGKDNSDSWKRFLALVNNSGFSAVKKQHILMKEIDEEGFKQRNLNDTRYITRFLCNWVENNIPLLGKGVKRVFAPQGKITALLRSNWGIRKVREDNDRHHAIDAIVVACTTVSIQQRITNYVKNSEINRKIKRQNYLKFPEPWKFFREDISIRVFSNNPIEELKQQLSDRPEANHQFVTPLFVSRAPVRKMTGQGHEDTIRSAKRISEGISVLRVPLTKLNDKSLELMVNREREKELYDALKQRLLEFKNDPEKAFAEPFYKKGGQQVKTVRIERVQKNGVLVNNNTGIADNGNIVRVDVFLKKKKYFLVPIYSWQVAKGILPNKAIVAHKNECDWADMDGSAQFLFSLYTNDLIEVVLKDSTILGYFSSIDRATAALIIKEPDMEKSKGKEGIHRVGVKTARSFIKYNVDVLGKNISRCRKAKRLPVR